MDPTDATSKVTGDQATIPARIRHALDIDDGDRLGWRLDEGVVRVEVLKRQNRTFTDFSGYDGEDDTDVSTQHDAWGVEKA